VRKITLFTLPLALAACGTPVGDPLPQWRVTIATDAPVPQLGDRLLIEVLGDDGQACSGCRRQLGAEDPARWPFSFGVVPPDKGGVRVRVRLYRTAVTGFDGAPGSDRILDTLARMPRATGVTDVAITLDMRCFGVPADPFADTSCDPASGAPAPVKTLSARSEAPSLPAPGSWAPARSVDCPSPPGQGMVCVPGGAFLLGSPDYLPTGDLDPVPEQLVQLDPFALDVDEMTVGEMRALVQAGMVSPPVKNGPGNAAHCTYTDSGNDDMPVNCVSRATARKACEARGLRLPTEAEWEMAAGNRDRETAFPWGDGSPCDHAIVGKGDPLDVAVSSACQDAATPLVGPEAVSAETTDVTLLGVRHMGGNVDEWVDDDVRPYDDPACWGHDPALHVNPRCASGTGPGIRGGSWGSLPVGAHVYARNGVFADGPTPFTGFRCAK
jgi:formylglycine-generating enzyme